MIPTRCAMLFLTLPVLLCGQERTVEVEGIGKEKKEAAYRDALDKAIRQGAGIRLLSVYQELRSGDVRSVNTSRQSLLVGLAEGLITQIDTVERARLLPGEQTDEEPVYRCLLSVTVRDRGAQDEFFKLGASIIPVRSVYRVGDEVEIRYTATRDCFVTLVSVGADNNLYLVGRSAGIPVKANETNSVGGLVMGLFEGMENASESMIAIATKEEFQLFSPDEQRIITGVMEGGKHGEATALGAFTNLGKALARLPEDQWTLALVGYSIIR